MVKFVLIPFPGGERSATHMAMFDSQSLDDIKDRVAVVDGEFWKFSREKQIIHIRSLLWNEENILIFVPGVNIPKYIPRDLIEIFKKDTSISSVVCYLVDAVDRLAHFKKMLGSDYIQKYLSFFDAIYSGSIYEAERYGLAYIDSPLKKFVYQNIQVRKKVFFCGREKGRLPLLKAVGKYLLAHDVECDFLILKTDKNKEYTNEDGVRYIDYIRYDNMVKMAQEADCLLGIVGEFIDTPGCSFRESILYNKKFLTNSPSLKKDPHYDSRYQKTFYKPEDIDIDWLKSDMKIQYNYDGCFELKVFFDSIEKDFQWGHLQRLSMLNQRLMRRPDYLPFTEMVLYRPTNLKFPARKGMTHKADISSLIPYGYFPKIAIARATGSNYLYFYYVEVDRLKNITFQIKNTTDEDVVTSPSVWILCEREEY